MGVSFETYRRCRWDVLMGRRGYVPLGRLGAVPIRRRWVFHLRLVWDVVKTYRWDVVVTSSWDVVTTFHRGFVGCFIWDVPATSLRRTERRFYDVATTFCCRVRKFHNQSVVISIRHIFCTIFLPLSMAKVLEKHVRRSLNLVLVISSFQGKFTFIWKICWTTFFSLQLLYTKLFGPIIFRTPISSWW